MTAWSAARLALKIALFTPSAGSLSESVSSAVAGSLDDVAQPQQHSRSPKANAETGFVRPLRYDTVSFSSHRAVTDPICGRIVLGTARRVKLAGLKDAAALGCEMR